MKARGSLRSRRIRPGGARPSQLITNLVFIYIYIYIPYSGEEKKREELRRFILNPETDLSHVSRETVGRENCSF